MYLRKFSPISSASFALVNRGELSTYGLGISSPETLRCSLVDIETNLDVSCMLYNIRVRKSCIDCNFGTSGVVMPSQQV